MRLFGLQWVYCKEGEGIWGDQLRRFWHHTDPNSPSELKLSTVLLFGLLAVARELVFAILCWQRDTALCERWLSALAWPIPVGRTSVRVARRDSTMAELRPINRQGRLSLIDHARSALRNGQSDL